MDNTTPSNAPEGFTAEARLLTLVGLMRAMRDEGRNDWEEKTVGEMLADSANVEMTPDGF